MELSEIGTWRLSQNCGLFFNESTQKLVLKNGRDVNILVAGQWELKYQFKDYWEKQFRNACFSSDESFLCYQVAHSEMVRDM